MINRPLKVFIIGQVWPEPTSSAAGIRMRQLIDLFLELGCAVVFASTAAKGEHSVVLPQGVGCRNIILNSSTFDNEVVAINPDIVVFDRFMTEEQFGWRVATNCPNAVRILNTEDLHCLRSVRQKLFKRGDSFTTNRLLDEDITKREIASIYRCDLSLMVSTYEMSLLEDTFKIDRSLLMYLPVFVDENADDLPTYNNRRDFIFIGNFLHEPNKDAVKYLKSRLWPRIHLALPEASMLIYGAYTTADIERLHDPKSNFEIAGRAADASEVVSVARVVLAPIKYGAGIKGKLLEAMACGTPSVTTTIGAEGIRFDDNWPGHIADDDERFIEAAVKLYTDEGVWKAAKEEGFKTVGTYYRATSYIKPLKDKILYLIENLEQHRRHNFIGSMLYHHSMRSTEFLSRWIEEKNK